MNRLLDIMARLRDPDGGCPWDREQTFASIAPYTLEEAYEVADAIERGDLRQLEEELGDLLLQVVFHARMAEEQGLFDFARVAEGIAAKMERRHPHVFGSEVVDSAAQQQQRWEEIKASEKAQSAQNQSLLGDVPLALPALTRAVKFGKRAARIGFDWPDAHGPRAKVDEELRELDEAVRTNDPDAMRAEFGDVLFALANLARHLDIDPERALRETNVRFATRFAAVEAKAKAEPGADLAALEHAWIEAKQRERDGT
jgi:tetrapyrrole methylase family protein/MazG family protein/ATP diphosphatase